MCSSQELLHHAGSNDNYQRLATRLAIERLACAWPAVAKMVPRRDGSLVAVNATPAVVACLAARLPLVPATTLVISREFPCNTSHARSVGLYLLPVHQTECKTGHSTANECLLPDCLVLDEPGER